MRSFFSVFFCSIFGAMSSRFFLAMSWMKSLAISCLVFCAMAFATSNASAQTPNPAAQTLIVTHEANTPNYNPALNPGIIPAPQMIEMSPRGGYTNFKKRVSRQNPNLPAEGYNLIIEKKQITIEYADNNGLVSHRIIDPLKLSAGSLLARDHATGEVQTFRIARITGVAAL